MEVVGVEVGFGDEDGGEDQAQDEGDEEVDQAGFAEGEAGGGEEGFGGGGVFDGHAAAVHVPKEFLPVHVVSLASAAVL